MSSYVYPPAGGSGGAGSELTDGHIFVGDASNQAADVAVSGEATIDNAGAVTLNNNAVIGKTLTGFTPAAGTVTSSDTILTALEKIDAKVTAGLTNPLTADLIAGAFNIESAGGNSTWTVFPSGGDDTAALQAAVTAAATAGAGVVETFDGVYTITGAITWPSTANNVILTGKGSGTIFNVEIPKEDPPTNPWAFDLFGADTTYACNNVSIGGTSITTTTAGDAANFALDDVVRVEGSDPDGVLLYQINRVVSVDAGTGVVTLLWPIEDTLTSVVLRRYRTGKNNGIMNLSIYHPGSSNAAHSIGLRFQYRPVVKNIYMNGAVGSGGDGFTISHTSEALIQNILMEDYDVSEFYPTVLDEVFPNATVVQFDCGSIFDNIEIRNSGQSGATTTASLKFGSGLTKTQFRNIKLIDNQELGISIGSTAQLNKCKFLNFNISSSGNHGVYGGSFSMKQCEFNSFIIDGTNYLVSASICGIHLQTPTYGKYNSFVNINTDNCGGEGMNIWGQDNARFIGCSGAANTGAGILLYQCEYVTVDGCSVNQSPNDGLWILDCDNVTINGGSFCGNTGRGMRFGTSSNIVVCGAVAKGNTANNFQMETTDANFTITGNDFGGTGVVYSTGSGHIIADNQDGLVGKKITAPTTFTPTVTLSGAGTVPTYVTNSGRYWISGQTCFVDVYLNGDGGTAGSGSTQLQIALPVPVSSSHLTDIAVNYPVGMAQNGTTQYFLYGSVDQATQKVFLRYMLPTVIDSNPLTGALQSDLTTRTIRLHFWYEAA